MKQRRKEEVQLVAGGELLQRVLLGERAAAVSGVGGQEEDGGRVAQDRQAQTVDDQALRRHLAPAVAATMRIHTHASLHTMQTYVQQGLQARPLITDSCLTARVNGRY